MASIEAELVQFSKLSRVIEEKTTPEEQALAMKDMLAFMVQSKHLLDEGPQSRQAIKEKLGELAEDPRYPIYKHEFIALCKKISNLEGVDMPIPGCKADTKPALTSEYIKAGTYGCAVKPALPNRLSTGEWIDFPENITKLFYEKEAANKAYNISNKLYQQFQNKGHKAYKYEYKNFKGSNLPANTRRRCRIENTIPLFPVRMPNLGYDFVSARKHIDLYRKIPFPIILSQIQKLISQVYQFYTTDNIHGDIRELNIMANPRTGDLTIIDFDWFHPSGFFFDEYHKFLGYYNNPPEALIGKYIAHIVNARDPELTIAKLINNRDYKIVSDYIKLHNFKYRNTPLVNDAITYDRFEDISQQTYRYFNDAFLGDAVTIPQVYHAYCQMMRPTFDSFGLGFSLLDFLYYVYTPVFMAENYDGLQGTISNHGDEYTRPQIIVIYNTIKILVNDVLKPMAAYEPWRRMPVDEAYTTMNDLVTYFQREIGRINQSPKPNEMRGGKTRKQKRKN
jgi:hypothetical protein